MADKNLNQECSMQPTIQLSPITAVLSDQNIEGIQSTPQQTNAQSAEPDDPCHAPRGTGVASSYKRRSRSAPTRGKAKTKHHGPSPGYLAAQMIDLKVDNWCARARIVHTVGQIEGSLFLHLAIDSTAALKGMNLFDRFEHTWYIPFDDESPLPSCDSAVAEELQKRRQSIQAKMIPKKNARVITKALEIITESVETNCQLEWDTASDQHGNMPVLWEDAKKSISINQMIEMVARHRLSFGHDPLPNYFRLNILQLDDNGKIKGGHQHIPPKISLRLLLAKLEQWFPKDDPHDDNIIELGRRKVQNALRKVLGPGKEKAHEIMRELGRPYYIRGVKGSERDLWSFKLHAKKKFYMATPSSGLANVEGWTPLTSDMGIQTIFKGIRAGKFPTVIRKIRLCKIWLEINALEKYIPEDDHGLSPEQLAILDDMLRTG